MNKSLEALIADMKTAAEKATPLQLDTAQIERDGEGYIECPCCEGAGDVEALTDFCNIDGVALGVQFYGIGEHHELAEQYFRQASPANVLALIAALEQAQQDSKELARFGEVVSLASSALKEGHPLDLESLFKGELASAMFAVMFAGEFVRHGAKNYLELLYAVPDFGDFTVTIQRKEGKTPGERIAELESRQLSVSELPTDERFWTAVNSILYRQDEPGYHCVTLGLTESKSMANWLSECLPLRDGTVGGE